MIGWFVIVCGFLVLGTFLALHRYLGERPCPEHPETGARCEMTGPHQLHVGSGVTWTDKLVRDLKDPRKRLIYELQKTRQAMERVATSVEHHTSESLHKVR